MKFNKALRLLESDPSQLITVSCYLHAEERAERVGARQVVSLLDPDRAPHAFDNLPEKKHLALVFNDHEENSVYGMKEAVQKLVDLGSSWRMQDEFPPTLVHCYGGVSRSTAATYILLCAGFVDLEPSRLFDILTNRLTHKPNPNISMIEIADQLLGAKGKMLAPAEAYRNIYLPRRAAHIRRQRSGLDHRQHK